MRAFCTSVIFCLFFNNGIAQDDFRPGYIITLQKDTVPGLVKFSPGKVRDGKCEFKKRDNGPIDLYTPAIPPAYLGWFGLTGEDLQAAYGICRIPDGKILRLYRILRSEWCY